MKFVFALPDGKTKEIDVLYREGNTAREIEEVNDALKAIEQPIKFEELSSLQRDFKRKASTAGIEYMSQRNRSGSVSEDTLFMHSTNAKLVKRFFPNGRDSEDMDPCLIAFRTINRVKQKLEKRLSQRSDSSRGKRSVSFSETDNVHEFDTKAVVRCVSEEDPVFTPSIDSAPTPTLETIVQANLVDQNASKSPYPPLVSPDTARKFYAIMDGKTPPPPREKSVTPNFFPAQDGSKLPERSASAMAFGGPKK